MVDRVEASNSVSLFALFAMCVSYICLSLVKFTDFKSSPTFRAFWCIQVFFQLLYAIVLCCVYNCEIDGGVSDHMFQILILMLFYIDEVILLFVDVGSLATEILMSVLEFGWWAYSVIMGFLLILILRLICIKVYFYCIVPCRREIIDCFHYFRDKKQSADERRALHPSLEDIENKSPDDVATIGAGDAY
jgi:hypothetical protein